MKNRIIKKILYQVRKNCIVFIITLFLVFSTEIRSLDIGDVDYNLAEYLFIKGRYTEAIKEFKYLIKNHIDSANLPKSILYLGESYFYLSEYGKAIEMFQIITIKHKDKKIFSKGLYWLALANYMQGIKTKDLKYTNRAISLFKKFLNRYKNSNLSDNSLYWLGECYYFKEERESAIASFKGVISRYPKGDKVISAKYKLLLMEGTPQASNNRDKEKYEKLLRDLELLKEQLDTLAEQLDKRKAELDEKERQIKEAEKKLKEAQKKLNEATEKK